MDGKEEEEREEAGRNEQKQKGYSRKIEISPTLRPPMKKQKLNLETEWLLIK